MSAVIVSFDPVLSAMNAAVRRAEAFGYCPLVIAQMRKEAGKRAAHGELPAVAAHRAVPPKSQRIGPTLPEVS